MALFGDGVSDLPPLEGVTPLSLLLVVLVVAGFLVGGGGGGADA